MLRGITSVFNNRSTGPIAAVCQLATQRPSCGAAASFPNDYRRTTEHERHDQKTYGDNIVHVDGAVELVNGDHVGWRLAGEIRVLSPCR